MKIINGVKHEGPTKTTAFKEKQTNNWIRKQLKSYLTILNMKCSDILKLFIPWNSKWIKVNIFMNIILYIIYNTIQASIAKENEGCFYLGRD